MVLNGIPIGIAGFITLYMIANHMKDVDYSYGIIAFAFGYLGMWKFITSFLRKAHIKRISEGKDLGRCIGTYIAGKIVLIVLYLMVVVGGLFVWKIIMHKGFESREHVNVIWVLILYMLFETGMDIFVATYEARLEIAKIEIGILFFAIIKMVAVMIGVHFGLSIYVLVAAYFAAVSVQIAFYIVMFKGYPIKRPSWSLMKSYFRFSFPILLAVGALGLGTTIVRVMIQLFWDSADVGHYFAAWRLAHVPTIAPLVAILLFPTFSGLHAEKRYSRISEYTHKAERYIAFISVPFGIVLILFARPVVHIILSDLFLPAVPMIRILAISGILAALNIPYFSQIIGTDRPWIYTIIIIIQGFLSFVITILLVPRGIHGIHLPGLKGTGAAAAVLISSIVGFILVRFVVRKYIVTGTKPYWRIYRFVISGAVMGVVLWILEMIWPLDNPSIGIDKGLMEISDHISVLEPVTMILMDFSNVLGYLIYFLAGLIPYIVMLIVLKELTKKDLRYFLDVLNPIKMLSYIRKELRI